MNIEANVHENFQAGMSFADKLRQKPQKPPIYTGESEVDELDKASLSFMPKLHLGSTNKMEPVLQGLVVQYTL